MLISAAADRARLRVRIRQLDLLGFNLSRVIRNDPALRTAPEQGVYFVVPPDRDDDPEWTALVGEYTGRAQLGRAGEALAGHPVPFASRIPLDGEASVIFLGAEKGADRAFIVTNASMLLGHVAPGNSITANGPGLRSCRGRQRLLRGAYSPAFLDRMEILMQAMRPRCPRCGSREAKRIQYGLRARPFGLGSDSVLHRGGCCVDLLSHDWRCGWCEREWTIGGGWDPLSRMEDRNPMKQTRNPYEGARASYRPRAIRCLLIAEAPPNEASRFFYYHEVPHHDHLFLSVMETLYPAEKQRYLAGGRSPRAKEMLLKRFQADGYFLLDLYERPVATPQPVDQALQSLEGRLRALHERGDFSWATPIIPVKANVCEVVAPHLVRCGYTRVNAARIPFPSSGQQGRFRQMFRQSLEQLGLA